jgi:hypothetical protein
MKAMNNSATDENLNSTSKLSIQNKEGRLSIIVFLFFFFCCFTTFQTAIRITDLSLVLVCLYVCKLADFPLPQEIVNWIRRYNLIQNVR